MSDTLPAWSFAQRAALVVGVWWTANGIGAFLIDSNFATGHVHGGGDALGLTITVNGWHALVHLIPGLLGIAASRRSRAALSYLLASGGLYVVVGSWGLLAGGNALGPIAVDSAGDLVHVIEGGIAILAVVASLVVRPRLAPAGS